jgi:4-diphosphocytidyl-2-C-methyl-D-erythritol kinase
VAERPGPLPPPDAAAEIVERAPAKLNLYLHVVGRRDDGYHLLDSLVAFSDVGDLVVASAAATDLSLAVDGPFAAALSGGDPEGNLVLRAARALAARLGVAPRARLRLIKNLPVASGIGGGSSDAAACLRALMRLWRAEIPPRDLAGLALSLGADVPVCLARRPAFLGGVGEALASAPPLPEAGLLLVNPGVALPTPAVFRARQGPFSEPARFAETPADAASLARALAARRNDLAPAAIEIVPAVADALAELERLPGALLARMSGSGATCFALFATPEAAAAAARRLSRERPAWWIASGRLLGDADAD